MISKNKLQAYQKLIKILYCQIQGLNYLQQRSVMKSQLDRILQSDLNQYKVAVTQRLQNIDHIQECLTERSNFINNFQNLLKKQIQSSSKSKSSKLKATNKQLNRKQTSLLVDDFQKDVQNRNIDKLAQIVNSQLQAQKQNSDPKRQFKYKFLSIQEQIKTKNDQKVLSLQKINQEKINYLYAVIAKLQRQYSGLLKQTKSSLRFFKAFIQQQIDIVQTQVTKNMQYCITAIQTSVKNKYQAQVRQLEHQNQLLTIKLLEQKEKKQQNISNQFSRMSLFDYQQPFFQSNMKKMTSREQCNYWPVQQNRNIIMKNEQPIWNHYQCNMGTSSSVMRTRPQSQKVCQSANNQPQIPGILRKNIQHDHSNYILPDIQKVYVQNSKVKKGFGTFKLGNQISYRGQWKNGQFHGQGKLTLPGYTYQGQFQNGSFHGCGTLSMDSLSYTGQFSNHQASGDGILKLRTQQIIGKWVKNRLKIRYQ